MRPTSVGIHENQPNSFCGRAPFMDMGTPGLLRRPATASFGNNGSSPRSCEISASFDRPLAGCGWRSPSRTQGRHDGNRGPSRFIEAGVVVWWRLKHVRALDRSAPRPGGECRGLSIGLKSKQYTCVNQCWHVCAACCSGTALSRVHSKPVCAVGKPVRVRSQSCALSTDRRCL